LLVGVTVGITLAVNSGGGSSANAPATPTDSTPAATTPPPPPGGGVAVGMAPSDAGDPWAEARAVEIDAAVTPDAAPAPTLEEAYGGLPPDFTKQVADARSQAKRSCQAVVTNKQLAAIPESKLQFAMCYCILGDKPNALKVFAKITDAKQREAVVTLCRYQDMELQ
jgi:hypothetical protein